ncbi:MAG: response regulator transcription factor [candidate division NC10 bacterium]|nr:response regulator transcription factor [candidate division NC10 bacterium]
MSRITVLIADDYALFREGLHLLLAQEKGIQVVGQAMDGKQALIMTEALQPDILLLSVQLPAVNGLDALPRIRAKSPGTKVLILSGYPGDDFIVEALQRGAKGCLSKTLTRADIVKAIRVTHAGELWAERKVLTQTLESLLQKGNQSPSQETHETLTNREREIIKWVMEGMSNKEIAAQLGISDHTVKTHLRNIFGKLKVNRRLQLLLYRIADRTA